MADQQKQPDLSRLSDADLQALANNKIGDVSTEGLNYIAGVEPKDGFGEALNKAKSVLYEALITGHPQAPGREPVEPTTAAEVVATPSEFSGAFPGAAKAIRAGAGVVAGGSSLYHMAKRYLLGH